MFFLSVLSRLFFSNCKDTNKKQTGKIFFFQVLFYGGGDTINGVRMRYRAKLFYIMANQKEQNNIKLNINPEVAKGTYSNLVVVSHNPTEILLDFAQMLPGIEGAMVRERVIMNPVHAKRLLAALNDNLKKYEQQFGHIVEPTPDGTVPYDILGKA